MKEFLYDGSFDGLLTTLFYAYPIKETVSISKEKEYIPTLFSMPCIIQTESDKSDRVYNGIVNKLSHQTLSNIYHLYLSDLDKSENLILNYMRLCFKEGECINLAKNNSIIKEVDLTTRRVAHEAHRFTGFVRFKEIKPLTFYASIEPDYNILPLLIGHFVNRFSDQSFIIHDLKRHLALTYTQKDFFIQILSSEESITLSKCNYEDSFEQLFKTYYKATTIEGRRNERCMRNFMPKRYFKHLAEL